MTTINSSKSPDKRVVLKYDPASGRMRPVEVERKSSPTGWVKGNVTFVVSGDLLSELVKFAREDGLDIAEGRDKGAAVNAYIRVAIQEWVEKRMALTAAKAAEAKGPMKAPETKPAAATKLPETKPAAATAK